jgi:hypothetical protein
MVSRFLRERLESVQDNSLSLRGQRAYTIVVQEGKAYYYAG